jgi:hypothetical protein
VIRKDDGEWVAECTECGTTEFGGTVEKFSDMVKYIKGLGWVVYKDDSEGPEEKGEWVHLCPDCVPQT